MAGAGCYLCVTAQPYTFPPLYSPSSTIQSWVNGLMPPDSEHLLLEQQLLSIYREIVAGPSTSGEFLMKRLASAMYARGVRATIGAEPATKEIVLHHSLDPEQRLCWVSKIWNQVMGYRARQAIGLHTSAFLAPETYHSVLPEWWSSVVMTGKTGPHAVTLVNARGELLKGSLTSEALRDSEGAFQRTFSRVKVRVPLMLLPLLFAACQAMRSTADLARRPQPMVAPTPAVDQPVQRKGVFRRPKVLVSAPTAEDPRTGRC